MAFPTQGVLDDGTGADADPIAGNWTKLLANNELRRVSSKIRGPNSNQGDDYWNLTVFGADSECYGTISVAPGSFEDFRFYVRMTGVSGNGYLGYFKRNGGGAGTDTYTIYKVTGGTTLASLATGTFGTNMAAGDKAGIEIIGTTINLKYKVGAAAWGTLATVTDATYSAAGYIGLTVNSPSASIVDFGGGTVGAVAALFIPKILGYQVA